jgi:hypothetical protein
METMRVSMPAEVMSTEVEGEAVLLNLEIGQYYSLDEVGTRMWALLAQHGQIEPVVQAMLDEYDAGEGELRQDLVDLVEELAAHGLLRVDET